MRRACEAQPRNNDHDHRQRPLRRVLCVGCLSVPALLLGHSLLVNPFYGAFPGAWLLREPDPWLDSYVAERCTLPTHAFGATSPKWPRAIPPLLHLVVKNRSAQRRRHVDNEERTASMFEAEVGGGGRVVLWDDDRCRAAVRCVARTGYAGRFDRETWGPFKADLCRYAVLYLHGGLYVDDDLEFIQDPGAPLRPADTLVAPREYGLLRGHNSGIFQAYLAAAPQHAALGDLIRELDNAPTWVSTDWNRVMLLKRMQAAPDARTFHESKLQPGHPLWRDARNATGFCNHVISEDDRDPIGVRTRPYAYSHALGSRNCRVAAVL